MCILLLVHYKMGVIITNYVLYKCNLSMGQSSWLALQYTGLILIMLDKTVLP